MQPTAASVARAAARPVVVPPLRGLGADVLDYSRGLQKVAHETVLREAVQLREEMRKERIRSRSVDAWSTSQAAFQDPAEQWQTYIERCGHVNGKWDTNRRVNSAEARSRMHKTADRIFSSSDDPAPSAAASFVDSHGMWVGEEVEAKLRGSAGVASTSLWKSRDDMGTDARRSGSPARCHSPLRTTEGATLAALASGTADGVYHLENRLSADRSALAADVAGLSSKKLCKSQREVNGLLASDSPRQLTAPATRPPLVEANARVAGLTSDDLFQRQTALHPRAQARDTGDGDSAVVAGRKSSEIGENAVEQHFGAAPARPASPGGRVQPELHGSRLGSEAMDIITNSGARQSAGRDVGTQRRYTSPLLGYGEKSTDVEPSRRLSRRPASPIRGAEPTQTAAREAETSQEQPLPARPRAPSKLVATVDVEPYAGQRSNVGRKPSCAWEANHLWSEAPRKPRPSDRAPEASGAGRTSSQIANSASHQRFELTPPRMRPTQTLPADATAVNAGTGGAAASASGAAAAAAAGGRAEGGGAGKSTGDLATAASRYLIFEGGSKPGRRQEASAAGLSTSQRSGSAGRSTHELGAAAPQADRQPKPLSEVSAHVAQAERSSPSKLSLDLSKLKSFSGAAGVTSVQVAVQEGKREFVSTPKRSNASGALANSWQGSTTGVASTVFGANADATFAAHDALAGSLLAGRHGMGSRDINFGRVPSRGEHEHHLAHGMRRSASEPRRRPTASSGSGEGAKDLLYGNRYDGGAHVGGRAASPPPRSSQMSAGMASSAVDHVPLSGGRRASPGRHSGAIVGGLGAFMGTGDPSACRAASPEPWCVRSHTELA